jgi:GNAT superfamily N-acetyltransferase
MSQAGQIPATTLSGRTQILHSAQMKITTRQVTKADYDFLIALRIETMGRYAEEIYGWDEDAQKEYFRKTFKPKSMTIIQCAGTDVGMYYVLEEEACYSIKRMEILGKYQNRGIGTHILRDILQCAEQENRAVRLRVFKINPARRLYERHGFQITGETATHYHMEKPNK